MTAPATLAPATSPVESLGIMMRSLKLPAFARYVRPACARAGDHLAVDELLLSASSLAECGEAAAVDLAQGALRGFVQGNEGVVGKEGAVAADGSKAEANVLGGIVRRGRGDEEAVVDAGEQRPMRAPTEVGLELGQADQDEREQRLRVPLVGHQDVQASQHVWMQQMRLVEEEDGVDLVAPQVVHVRFDGQEEIRGRRRRGQAERVTEVPVEVATAERRVVAIGQAEAGLREALPERAQDGRLADAWLTHHEHAGPLGGCPSSRTGTLSSKKLVAIVTSCPARYPSGTS